MRRRKQSLHSLHIVADLKNESAIPAQQSQQSGSRGRSRAWMKSVRSRIASELTSSQRTLRCKRPVHQRHCMSLLFTSDIGTIVPGPHRIQFHRKKYQDQQSRSSLWTLLRLQSFHHTLFSIIPQPRSHVEQRPFPQAYHRI